MLMMGETVSGEDPGSRKQIDAMRWCEDSDKDNSSGESTKKRKRKQVGKQQNSKEASGEW